MKKVLIALVIILVGIQFIPVERTNPPVTQEINAPEQVKSILKKACYDCHSNETNWAWYTKIAPSSFLASKDVKDGREHLNFSEWDKVGNKVAKVKEEIWEEVRDEKMPPWQYRIMHSEAKLTDEEKNILRNWASN
ncbi:MAG: heme-binding domain-containing protein [Ignavibacterium sp.]|uniref:heme-binding domain-containing protein n=1 Tax=Ignavibacterium album TaxID=591197 RepID=UPI0026EED399|nr:heme-binding domain-containing protein [Ignavibacterium album]MCA2004353.1 heme-binding domain-containing protein [Ignavibacterium sp.]MCX8104346.1 heme-binding domain-containing protein [Ignavibacterium album]